ncbi:MAG: ArgE/DapE family deacylase [Acidimicrobiales bacterium]
MLKLRSDLEEKAVAEVARGSDELSALVCELIACDTTARDPGDPAHDEEKLERILDTRLKAVGATTEIWEPEPIGPGHPYIDAELDFHGRPQLVANIAGSGGGRSLLLNGHVDAVDIGMRELWSSDPLHADVRDGRMYGRGSCDMKGGLASLEFAVEALHRAGIRLRGDIVFCANTDEESSGVGAWATVRHGVHADAGICAEPTGFDVYAACRGISTGVLTVTGRSGHAEMPQPHWTAGGAVNAIEKALPLIDSLRRLREEWRLRPDQQHPLLSPSAIVPTILKSGTWSVTYPETCQLTCDFEYLPHMIDAQGTGAPAHAEVMEWTAAVAAGDPWLAEHPPRWEWIDDNPPAEVAPDHEIVTLALGAGADIGRTGRVTGLDSWADAATYTLHGHTPTVSFGPGELHYAHAIDENVPIQDLIDHCSAVTLILMRWCGTAD